MSVVRRTVVALALLAFGTVAPGVARGQLAPPNPGSEALERPRGDKTFSLDGYLRMRGDLFYNVDLDRGPTPSGRYLFPVPASNPRKQLLESADMRLRLEPAWQVNRTIRLVMQVDVLENVVFGSTPAGLPATPWTPLVGASLTQRSPEAGRNAWSDAIAVRRAWGEVLLPFGLLMVGRQGALVNWGTGFFINSGRGLDDDRSDSGDRITFATSLAGHLWMLAFEWSAVGPTSPGALPSEQPFNIDRGDDVRTVAFGFAKYHSPGGLRRRADAKRASINYGLIASYRRQALDIPTYYAPTSSPFGPGAATYSPADFVRRDMHTVTADLWFRLIYKGFRLELEAAVLWGRVGDASLDPGVSLRQAIESLQYGGVLLGSWTSASKQWTLGFEFGIASGDPAPGFGVRTPRGQASAARGDIDGPQFRLPGDTRVDNFRFHPNYRVDLILFRRIIGTVTDAAYVRPYARWKSNFGLTLEGVLIASFAVSPESPPGQKSPLGVELDLGARYRFDNNFIVQLGLGVLFPLAGLDNLELGLRAKPAVALHALVGFLL